MCCTVKINLNRADLVPVGFGPHISVANWRLVRRPTSFGLLLHALLGFGGEVGAVELRDGGHDAVEQFAAGGFVDVLRGGDDLSARRPDVHHDGDVVFAGAGQAVDLVDDDPVDVPCQPEALQHGLELRSGGGAGAFAAVDVFVDDGGAEGFGLAPAGLSLGRDGEAFTADVGLGLFGGGDPEVDDGSAGCGGWAWR